MSVKTETDGLITDDPQVQAQIARAAELTHVIAGHQERTMAAAEERRRIWEWLSDHGVPHRAFQEPAGVSKSCITKELRIARRGRP